MFIATQADRFSRQPAIRRLARRGGVKRISASQYCHVLSLEHPADLISK